MKKKKPLIRQIKQIKLNVKATKTSAKKYSSEKKSDDSVKDAVSLYRKKKGPVSQGVESFRIIRGGKATTYSIQTGFGHFIGLFLKARNLHEISQVVEKGIPSKEIQPLIDFLDFTVPEIARVADVSVSTVSRWEPGTPISVSGSSQFFKIDELMAKGVKLFGGEIEFRNWLNSPNLALGNKIPAKLILSPIDIEMVDEALDALNYGTVM